MIGKQILFKRSINGEFVTLKGEIKDKYHTLHTRTIIKDNRGKVEEIQMVGTIDKYLVVDNETSKIYHILPTDIEKIF